MNTTAQHPSPQPVPAPAGWRACYWLGEILELPLAYWDERGIAYVVARGSDRAIPAASAGGRFFGLLAPEVEPLDCYWELRELAHAFWAKRCAA
jgi:hypothetical protein